jgi:hypothetical protein
VQSWRTSSPEAILKQIMESALGGDRGSNMNVTCRDCHVRQHPLCTDGKVQGRTFVEGAGERCDGQHCGREHGCGGEVGWLVGWILH